MVRRAFAVFALAVVLAKPALAEIGKVKSSIGSAVVQRGEVQIPAKSGQDLMPGDWLETGKDGRISLTFVDNTRFSVGPDSRIALKAFEYDPTTQQGSFVAKVERGSIAVVSGRIAKTRCGGEQPEAAATRCGMQVETPKAVLAVRGTRFVLTVSR